MATEGRRIRSIRDFEREYFPVRHAARARRCPSCGAEPYKPCIALRERMPLEGVHAERVEVQRDVTTERSASRSMLALLYEG